MDKKIFNGKSLEEAVNKGLIELHQTKENLYIKELEVKKGLFKSNYEIEIITHEEVNDYIKDSLKDLLTKMGITSTIEIKRKEISYNITIYSDNDSILIGKQGRTIQALNIIIRQMINVKFEIRHSFTIDVADYKVKKIEYLEIQVKRIAKEVATTKIAVKLDPMNSYERRIVHNALNDNKGVCTKSIGEEPNRYVVIEAKED